MEQKGKDLILHQAELSTNKELKAITNSGGWQSSVIVTITNQDGSVQPIKSSCGYEIDRKDAKLLIAFLQSAFDL